MSDEIFREVDEDVRRDQIEQFWKRHQLKLIGVAILIVAGVAAFRFYDYERQRQAEAAGARFMAANELLTEGKTAEAETAFAAIAADSGSGYRTLARFAQAGALGAHDAAAGARAYDGLAEDAGIDPALRGIARLRAAALLLDSASAKEIATRLEPIAGENDVMRAPARELLALSALKHDDLESAGRWLDAILTDPASPQSLRERAEILLGLVRSGAKPAAK